MRPILALLALTLTCGPSYSPQMPLGGRDVAVAIVDCLSPHREWVTDEVLSFGWHVSEAGQLTIRCTEIEDPTAAEQYTLGTNEVRLDPKKANDSFKARAASGHGAVHWLLNHGPRPEMGRYHVCSWAFNESPPPNCYPLQAASNALMFHDLGGSTPWNGDYETFTIRGIPEYRVTEVDKAFMNWALNK